MTLWGETAQDKGPLLEAQDCPVITVTACRVSDYNGSAPSLSYFSAALQLLYATPHSPHDLEGPCATSVPQLMPFLLWFSMLCSFEVVAESSMSLTSMQLMSTSAGVSVSAGQRSDIQINPDTPEVQALRQWYEFEGRTASTSHAGEGLANARSATAPHAVQLVLHVELASPDCLYLWLIVLA